MNAKINLLDVEFSPDAFGKMEALAGIEPLTRGSLTVEMPCLVFDEHHLYTDGFFAFQLLERLRAKTGKFWFIYGAFESYQGLRSHLVLPAEQVPQKFVVYRWGVEEWIKEILTI